MYVRYQSGMVETLDDWVYGFKGQLKLRKAYVSNWVWLKSLWGELKLLPEFRKAV
jgi:hypothetical protein